MFASQLRMETIIAPTGEIDITFDLHTKIIFEGNGTDFVFIYCQFHLYTFPLNSVESKNKF